jgi:hypothetical protein
MPNVAFTRDEINQLFERWELVRDCLSGQRQIKFGLNRVKYLPRPNASDESRENKERYEAYVRRAIFYNVTGRTLKGLIGQVFAKDPSFKKPTELDIFEDDIDGGGVSIDQQASKTLGYTLAFGRAGLLVDYPTVSEPTSKEETDNGDVRPTVTLFEPWQVINWRTQTIGAKKLLTLVVITETNITNDDGFEHQFEDRYRVLRLVNGIYTVEFWVKTVDQLTKQTSFALQVPPFAPLDGSGNTWDEIPFTFVGSENNDASADLPPLYDMAEINIGHYRNSADYEEACFICGQPTPVLTGLTQNWVDNVLKGTVQLGSRAAIPLPVGANAVLLQAAPNIMPHEAMQDKERQMVALGARLVEQATVQRTAMEAGLEEATESSILSKCAKNVSRAYSDCLKWAVRFVNGQEDINDDDLYYELNTKFNVATMDAQTLAGCIAAWQANAISIEEMRAKLIESDFAYQDMEEYKASLETAGPALGMPVQQQKLDDAAAAQQMQADALKAKSGGKPGVPVKAA